MSHWFDQDVRIARLLRSAKIQTADESHVKQQAGRQPDRSYSCRLNVKCHWQLSFAQAKGKRKRKETRKKAHTKVWQQKVPWLSNLLIGFQTTANLAERVVLKPLKPRVGQTHNSWIICTANCSNYTRECANYRCHRCDYHSYYANCTAKR